MRHVAEKQGLVLEKFYEQVGWPLYRKYGHAYDAFKLAVQYVAPPPKSRRGSAGLTCLCARPVTRRCRGDFAGTPRRSSKASK